VVGDLPRRPQRPQHGQALLEDRRTLAERQAERLELPPHAVLRVAHAGAEDGSAAAQLVQGGPLQGQVERVARRGDQAGGAELGPRGPLRDRREQADRLEPGLGEKAVAHPDGAESPLLREFRQRLLQQCGGVERIQRVAESGVHSVAGHLDDQAAVGLDRLAR